MTRTIHLIYKTHLDIGFTDHGISEKCPVSDLRRLSPDEVAAIPKKDLP